MCFRQLHLFDELHCRNRHRSGGDRRVKMPRRQAARASVRPVRRRRSPWRGSTSGLGARSSANVAASKSSPTFSCTVSLPGHAARCSLILRPGEHVLEMPEMRHQALMRLHCWRRVSCHASPLFCRRLYCVRPIPGSGGSPRAHSLSLCRCQVEGVELLHWCLIRHMKG